MFARTTSTARLSVTLAVICIVVDMLKVLFASGMMLMTSGGVLSSTVKLVVSVLLILPLLSLAMMVIL